MTEKPEEPAWVYPTKRVGGSLAFAVPYPGVPDKVLWCAACVVTVGCPQCRSAAGVPCMGSTRYTQETHYMRRDLYRFAKAHGFKLTKEQFELLDAKVGRKMPRKIVRPPSSTILSRLR